MNARLDKDKKETPENLEHQPSQGSLAFAAQLDRLHGVYCNVAIVHHSKNEFVLDFIFDLAGQGNLVSRVITNPEHIKKVYLALETNIQKYEEKFGEIKIDKQT